MGIIEDIHDRLVAIEQHLGIGSPVTPVPTTAGTTADVPATTTKPTPLVVGENTASAVASSPAEAAPSIPPAPTVGDTESTTEDTAEGGTEEAPGLSGLEVTPTHPVGT